MGTHMFFTRHAHVFALQRRSLFTSDLSRSEIYDKENVAFKCTFNKILNNRGQDTYD